MVTTRAANGALLVKQAAPHVPLLRRATEPSLEEKMGKVHRRAARQQEREGSAGAGGAGAGARQQLEGAGEEDWGDE